MSFELLNLAWKAKLPPSAKAVLVSLADHANEDRACWPSVKRLMNQTNLSRRTVQRSLRFIEGMGMVHIWPTESSSLYILTLGVTMAQGGRHAGAGGRHSDAGGGVTMTHEPSIEPSREPPMNHATNEKTFEAPITNSEAPKPNQEGVKSGNSENLRNLQTLQSTMEQKTADAEAGRWMKKKEVARKTKPGLPRFLSSGKVAKYWTDMMIYKYPDNAEAWRVASRPSQKVLGQLTQAKIAVGETKFRVILGRVLDNWGTYTSFVRSQNGLPGPTYPEIGYLLVTIDKAVMWVNQPVEPAYDKDAAVEKVKLANPNMPTSTLEIIKKISGKA